MAKFRGQGKKYNKEILQGAASAAVGGAFIGATLGHKRNPAASRATNAGAGSGTATSAYLLGYGIRKGYKGYKAKKSTKLLNTGGVKRNGKKV